jgi:glutamyl-tRNA reductase
MELVVVGLSHRTAPLDLRERMAFTAMEAEESLRAAEETAEISERLLLSTCNRTEFYSLTETTEMGKDLFLQIVRERRGIEASELDGSVYVMNGREMVAHLFRVAASVDSMVLGEAQILGQVHDAFEIARRAGTTGPLMHRLLEAAFRVGKRVRTETEIGSGAVSVSSAAVNLAAKIFSDMPERVALLIGSGETGELAARHLKEQGIGRLLVANRTPERAVALAKELDGEAVSFDDLEGALSHASILVSATASPVPLVRHDMVRRVVSARGNRPLLILDIAVPRDVERSVGDLQNVFLYDIDALQGLVNQNLERRKREIPKVDAIIEHELEQFLRWYGSLDATPVIRELRDRFERIRAEEVERHARKFREEDRAQIDALTRSIVNKLLHEPSVAIRALHKHAGGPVHRLEIVRRLFGLGGDEPDGKA